MKLTILFLILSQQVFCEDNFYDQAKMDFEFSHMKQPSLKVEKPKASQSSYEAPVIKKKGQEDDGLKPALKPTDDIFKTFKSPMSQQQFENNKDDLSALTSKFAVQTMSQQGPSPPQQKPKQQQVQQQQQQVQQVQQSNWSASVYEKPQVKGVKPQEQETQQSQEDLQQQIDNFLKTNKQINQVINILRDQQQVSKKDLVFIQTIIEYYRQTKPKSNNILSDLVKSKLGEVKNDLVAITQKTVIDQQDDQDYSQLRNLNFLNQNLKSYLEANIQYDQQNQLQQVEQPKQYPKTMNFVQKNLIGQQLQQSQPQQSQPQQSQPQQSQPQQSQIVINQQIQDLIQKQVNQTLNNTQILDNIKQQQNQSLSELNDLKQQINQIKQFNQELLNLTKVQNASINKIDLNGQMKRVEDDLNNVKIEINNKIDNQNYFQQFQDLNKKIKENNDKELLLQQESVTQIQNQIKDQNLESKLIKLIENQNTYINAKIQNIQDDIQQKFIKDLQNQQETISNQFEQNIKKGIKDIIDNQDFQINNKIKSILNENKLDSKLLENYIKDKQNSNIRFKQVNNQTEFKNITKNQFKDNFKLIQNDLKKNNKEDIINQLNQIFQQLNTDFDDQIQYQNIIQEFKQDLEKNGKIKDNISNLTNIFQQYFKQSKDSNKIETTKKQIIKNIVKLIEYFNKHQKK